MGKAKRLLSLTGGLVFILGFLYHREPAWAQGQPLTFSAYGDIPYGSSDYPTLQQHITDHNRYSPSAFILHIGDILSGSCDESKYADFANFMKGLAVPAYLVVGDNEYSDCDDPVAALAMWKKYFLTFGENFCGAPYTEHQSVRPENIAFTMNGVLFVGINLVGGSVHDQNEWDTRMQQDADWVSQQFQAKVSQVRAAVVFAQTGNRSAVTPFTTLFRAAAAAFTKPVLYIHGDLHSYKLDQPWPEQNITRLEVPKGNAESPLEVTVTMTTNPPQSAFTVKRNPWSGVQSYNMPPCVSAGSDQTLTPPAAASLQGQATDDGDPNGSLTTTWSMVSGPGTVTFGNANALATTASFSAPGAYVLRLTANDGQLQKSDEVTIVAPSAGPALSINDVNINEGNAGTTEAVFTVNLAGPNGQTVTVAYQTANATATSSDYLPTSGTLSFPNGTTTQTIHVMIQGDQNNEPDETFFVNLSNASNATLADAQGLGTISNDDFLPTIDAFSPASGITGTVATITGSHFTGATGVAFNGTAAGFTVDSDAQINTTVPAGAGTGKISVTNTVGTTQSVTNFVVIAPPTIAAFTPTLGPEGTDVTITGSSLAGITSVHFNGAEAASIWVDSDSQIRARVPAGAIPAAGKILVTNAAGSATSANDFTITAAPVTFSFTPKHDAYVKSSSATKNYGTAGTVREKMSSSEIDHSYLKFEVTDLSGTLQNAKLRLNVSDASTDGGAIYLVSNNYKSSATPWIESGLNWNNAPGVSGAVLSAVGAVSAGQWVEFDVTPAIVGNGTYSFGLKNNVSDIVYYRSKEGGASTVPQLVIQSLSSGAPSIASFAPAEGSVGTEVTITGSNLSGTTEVTFNGVPASFNVDSNTKIRATVPDGATTGKIRITNADGSASYAADFLVTVVPAIASFTPASGGAGTEVTITGSHFTGTTSVSFNGKVATSFFVDSDSQIRASVPAGATPGAGKIIVANSAGSAESTADFTINLLFTFAPIHDAYVKSSSPTNNYGTAGTVRGKLGSSEINHGYLKFAVTGLSGTLLSAKLRLYVTDASTDGGVIYLISDNYKSSATPWIESGLNWNNAPYISGTVLGAAPQGAVSVGQWVEFDVTPAIVSDGTYSFGLKNNVSDVVYYSSKEGDNDPQLVILLGGSAAAASKRADLAPNPLTPESENVTSAIPNDFVLQQNYPNPFNPSTQIQFGLPQASHVAIKVYTINGAEVETLVDGQYPAGTHAITFRAENLSSGVYFYVMQAGEVRQVRRLMLVK